MKIAFLFSGRGSNMEKVLEMCSHPEAADVIEPVLAITDKRSAGGIEVCEKYDLNCLVLPIQKGAIEGWCTAVTTALQRAEVDLVILAGFMRILPDIFCRQWEGRMINLHPSLLPKYKGLDTHLRALEAGDSIAGCTVHWVNSELDGGPIIAQCRVRAYPTDTPAQLQERVLHYEHQLLPRVVWAIAVREVWYSEGVTGHPLRIEKEILQLHNFDRYPWETVMAFQGVPFPNV